MRVTIPIPMTQKRLTIEIGVGSRTSHLHRARMIPLDLHNKTALVTGVGDELSFAWFIAKALQAAGAKLVFACHPRMVGIVENILERDADAEYRKLPFDQGTLK